MRRNWPPMGTELAQVAPKVTAPEFTRPGIWSWALAKARGLPTVSPPPRATVAFAEPGATGKSTEVSTWKMDAFCPAPMVTELATNVKTVAPVATMAPTVVHTTVAEGFNTVAMIPVVAQPAAAGVVTPVRTMLVKMFFVEKKLSLVKVRVRTLLARAAVTFPAAVRAQLAPDPDAAHATDRVESSENPTRGIATWVTPDTMEGTKLTVKVVDVETVDAERAIIAGTVV